MNPHSEIGPDGIQDNTMSITEDFLQEFEDPYNLAYWISRWFINSDHGVGKETDRMHKIATTLKHRIRTLSDETLEEKLNALHKVVYDGIFDGRKEEGTKISDRLKDLCQKLKEELKTVEHYKVLAITLEKIVIPTNQALQEVPDSDQEIAIPVAESILQTRGPEGVADVIKYWDMVGKRGCMEVERKEVRNRFAQLHNFLEDQTGITEESIHSLLTAFVQEYERRAGQKRQPRSGQSLEDVTTFIVNYYDIPTTEAPEHLTDALELDRVVENDDGHKIAISCKRTLRERWKQADTSNLELLDHYGVKEMWHVITFDNDLSDTKLRRLGKYRGIFYLREEGTRYRSAASDPELKEYVRPLSDFIPDLKGFTNV